MHGKSGFHVDPYHGDQAAALMEEFFEAAAKDISAWEKMSDASLQRIKEKYTWALYADRLMTLTRVYRYVLGLKDQSLAILPLDQETLSRASAVCMKDRSLAAKLHPLMHLCGTHNLIAVCMDSSERCIAKVKCPWKCMAERCHHCTAQSQLWPDALRCLVQLLEVCEQVGQARDKTVSPDVLHTHDAPAHCQGNVVC